jgi:hypothetical protein
MNNLEKLSEFKDNDISSVSLRLEDDVLYLGNLKITSEDNRKKILNLVRGIKVEVHEDQTSFDLSIGGDLPAQLFNDLSRCQLIKSDYNSSCYMDSDRNKARFSFGNDGTSKCVQIFDKRLPKNHDFEIYYETQGNRLTITDIIINTIFNISFLNFNGFQYNLEGEKIELNENDQSIRYPGGFQLGSYYELPEALFSNMENCKLLEDDILNQVKMYEDIDGNKVRFSVDEDGTRCVQLFSKYLKINEDFEIYYKKVDDKLIINKIISNTDSDINTVIFNNIEYVIV